MTYFSVTLTAAVAAKADATAEALAELAEELIEPVLVVTKNLGGSDAASSSIEMGDHNPIFTFHFDVPAPSPAAAAEIAQTALATAAEVNFPGLVEVLGVEAVTYEEADRRDA